MFLFLFELFFLLTVSNDCILVSVMELPFSIRMFVYQFMFSIGLPHLTVTKLRCIGHTQSVDYSKEGFTYPIKLAIA